MEVKRNTDVADAVAFSDLDAGDLFQWIEDANDEGMSVYMKGYDSDNDTIIDIADGEVNKLSDFGASSSDKVVKITHEMKVSAR